MAVDVDVDVVVVGAGVVGLAVAAELAESGRSTLVVERRTRVGAETSSRSSEVVHAGLYDPPGSLKARLCVAGNRAIYRLTDECGIPTRRTGKLVVATEPDELAALEELARQGAANGVPGLCLLDAAEVGRLEPRVRCVAALLSPVSGIVDSHALVRHFEARTYAAGGDVAFGGRVVGLDRRAGGLRVTVAGPGADESAAVLARAVVNAAGLEADRVAALAGLDVDALGYRVRPVKGCTFSLAAERAAGIERLLYPVPPSGGGGLGIHLTLDLAGRARLGPDARLVDRPPPGADYDYAVDAADALRFAAAARRFLPDVTARDLAPDRSGVRPALAGPGEPRRDFVVHEESDHGVPGLVTLAGIDSPGLTAAPALACHVRQLLDEAVPR